MSVIKSRICLLCASQVDFQIEKLVTCRNLAFFKRKVKTDDKDHDGSEDETRYGGRRHTKYDGPLTQQTTGSLKEHSSLRTTPAYDPPGDSENRVKRAVSSLYRDNGGDWRQVSLAEHTAKFRLLMELIGEFKHDIPSSEMDRMHTAGDVLDYFTQPVKDTTSYEDLSKLPLPPNLHIQMNPIRFDAKTDTFFNGLTAFPGRPVIVTSLKYKHKYPGTHIDETWPKGYIPRRGDE